MNPGSRPAIAFHASPLGPLLLCASDEAVLAVLWPADAGKPGRVALPAGAARLGSPAGHPLLGRLARELDEYFAGERRTFDLPLAPGGASAPDDRPSFRRRVWDALRDIPYGATTSYGALAARLGSPGAARAVGAAVGANPISILLPCHRVLGARGALTGFAGGLEAKRFLLALEARRAGG